MSCSLEDQKREHLQQRSDIRRREDMVSHFKSLSRRLTDQKKQIRQQETECHRMKEMFYSMESTSRTLTKEHERSLETVKQKVEEYAASLCRQLCQKVQDTLPRELRDEVYHYLLPIYERFDVSEARKRFNETSFGFRLDVKFLGDQTFAEMRETFCHDTRFYFQYEITSYGTCSVGIYRWFHQKDRWGEPRGDAVRKVEIAITHSYWREEITPWLYRDLAKDIDSLQTCRTGMSFHLKISHPSHLTEDEAYDLELPPAWPKNWDVGCLPLLQQLFPNLLKLKELGHEVAIYVPFARSPGYRYDHILEGFILEGVGFSEESFRSGRLKVYF